jgi:hypothetical protein
MIWRGLNGRIAHRNYPALDSSRFGVCPCLDSEVVSSRVQLCRACAFSKPDFPVGPPRLLACSLARSLPLAQSPNPLLQVVCVPARHSAKCVCTNTRVCARVSMCAHAPRNLIIVVRDKYLQRQSSPPTPKPRRISHSNPAPSPQPPTTQVPNLSSSDSNPACSIPQALSCHPAYSPVT